jgi:phenylacetate-CoA ligase
MEEAETVIAAKSARSTHSGFPPPVPDEHLLDRLSNLAVARLTFPITNLLMNRRGIVATYNEVLRTERASPSELERVQLERLQRQIAYAARWVPWYRARFRKIGLDPRDIRTLDDLKRIPPLTREDVIEHHRDMVDERQRDSIGAAEASRRDAAQPIPFALLRRHRLVRNNSSGSTGAPTVFFEDGSVTALNWALESRLKNLFGVGPGAREARMVRLSTTYVAASGTNRWRRSLWHQLILPGVNLRAADYEFCRKQLNEYRPKVIWGFTGALTGLAEHLKNTGRQLTFRPSMTIGWAAPVYDHEKALLEDVFHCPATNVYGSREVGHLALKCPSGQFHVNQEYMILETVPAGGDCPDGAGELVATTLVRTPMPFIRYRMGDIARVAPSTCACGRTLQVLEEFVGRTGEIFTTRDGRMIPPNFWCRLFMGREIPGAVKRFQVAYTKDRDIKVRIVPGASFSAETESYLNKIMRDNFSPATRFSIEYIDEIKAAISGKYLMVYREN